MNWSEIEISIILSIISIVASIILSFLFVYIGIYINKIYKIKNITNNLFSKIKKGENIDINYINDSIIKIEDCFDLSKYKDNQIPYLKEIYELRAYYYMVPPKIEWIKEAIESVKVDTSNHEIIDNFICKINHIYSTFNRLFHNKCWEFDFISFKNEIKNIENEKKSIIIKSDWKITFLLECIDGLEKTCKCVKNYKRISFIKIIKIEFKIKIKSLSKKLCNFADYEKYDRP